MRGRIDQTGRVVIPKPIQDALGLEPGMELDIDIDGAGVRLEPMRGQGRAIEVGDDGLPLLAHVEGVRLTDANVRRLRGA